MFLEFGYILESPGKLDAWIPNPQDYDLIGLRCNVGIRILESCPDDSATQRGLRATTLKGFKQDDDVVRNLFTRAQL